MAKYVHIILFLSITLQGCYNDKDGIRKENEWFTINELLLLRTEGLILAERAVHYTDNTEVQRMCQRITAYYKNTHPDFMQLCQNRVISVQEEDFDVLWEKIDNYLHEQRDNAEEAFVSLCHDNILRSIALYEIILDRDDWEDITYFSYHALPDLYNQHKELVTYHTERMKTYKHKQHKSFWSNSTNATEEIPYSSEVAIN